MPTNNSRKHIFTIITIIVLLCVSSYYFYSYINNRPKSTGGIISEAKMEDVNEGLAINNLLKRLPYTNDNFMITEYDYSIGKFIVVNSKKVDSSELEKTFFEWKDSSEYRNIKNIRFKFI